jgi:phage/plasmid-like protein (TIGR03299 family)
MTIQVNLNTNAPVSQQMATIRAANRGRFGTLPWDMNAGFTKLEENVNMEEAIVAGKLDYTVNKEQLYLPDQKPADDFFGLVRQDTRQTFGVVGKVYEPVQNRVKFNFFNDFLQSGQVKISHVGSLEGGKKTVIVCRLNLPNSEIVPGDAIAKDLLLYDTFDGKSSIKISLMTVRLICSNGAVRSEKTSAFRLRHNRNSESRLDDVRRSIQLVDENFNELIEQYKLIATKKIPNKEYLQTYIKQVLEMTETEKLKTRSQNILDAIVMSAESSNNRPDGNLTLWSAYNAITEYTNHVYGHNHNTRLNSLFFGQGAKVNNRALDVALSMAA